MRLLFANAYFHPERYEGSRIHIEQLIKNLAEIGCEVWVHSTNPVDCARKLPRNYARHLAALHAMDIFYFRVEGRPPIVGRYLKMLDQWRKLGFGKIVWEINAASDYVASWSGMRDELDVALAKQARQVDLAICNTSGLAQFASELGIQNVRTIPLASAPDMFGMHVPYAPDVSRKPDRLNVVWMGNPSAPWHDFETIRKAAWQLKDNERIRFYFIGEHPPNMRFTDNVIMKGSIPYAEIPSYLKAMDVGLAIYRNPSWSRYGVFSSPLKLFDYFAAELVVVASPIEQVVKCIEDKRNGFIVPFENCEALVNCLCSLAERKSQLKQIGKRARSLVTEYYNWQRVAEETMAAMQELVGRQVYSYE